MAIKFFGQFLIEQGIISHTMLLKAIELQERTNRRLGEVLLDMGLMTQEEIERVHQAQRSEDVRFGDKAVAMGLLTEEQLNQALTRQLNSHLYIGKALVKVGALSERSLAHYLEQFKKDQQPYMVEKVEIPAAVANQPIWEMVADLTYKMLTRIAGMSFRPGSCEIINRLPPRTIVAEMGFTGSVSARYLLSVSPNSRKIIARAILQENNINGEPAEVLDDSVMEFINIICGNIAAKAAQSGFQLEISPPSLHPDPEEGIRVPDDHTGLMFPIYLNDGEIFELAIFISNDRR